MIKLTESPRDALQGLPQFVPTEKKIQFISKILEAGFDVVEVGSFVSEKAIPQMKDTSEVLGQIKGITTKSKIQVLVGNQKYATYAVEYPLISILSYPFSASDIFLRKNLNTTLEKSIETIESIREISITSGKGFTVYLAMAFGNPYQETWNLSILHDRISILKNMGIVSVLLSDTIGCSTPETISQVFMMTGEKFADLDIGFHLHSKPDSWLARIDSAYHAGCTWFEGVIGDAGGCPMTGHDMIGNISTLNLIAYFENQGCTLNLNKESIMQAVDLASFIF